MEIQLQALTMHVLTSLLYMLQRMNEKKNTSKLSRSKAQKPQQVAGYKHKRKTSGHFYST